MCTHKWMSSFKSCDTSGSYSNCCELCKNTRTIPDSLTQQCFFAISTCKQHRTMLRMTKFSLWAEKTTHFPMNYYLSYYLQELPSVIHKSEIIIMCEFGRNLENVLFRINIDRMGKPILDRILSQSRYHAALNAYTSWMWMFNSQNIIYSWVFAKSIVNVNVSNLLGRWKLDSLLDDNWYVMKSTVDISNYRHWLIARRLVVLLECSKLSQCTYVT